MQKKKQVKFVFFYTLSCLQFGVTPKKITNWPFKSWNKNKFYHLFFFFTLEISENKSRVTKLMHVNHRLNDAIRELDNKIGLVVKNRQSLEVCSSNWLRFLLI